MRRLLSAVILSLLMAFSTVASVSYAEPGTAAVPKSKKIKGQIKATKKLHTKKHRHHKRQAVKLKKAKRATKD
ncbi:MAG: hypothetical protein HY591_04045 [Candidatus Omnitrophica bacterium]|nr:hypothetical protein [Candidatus Omnitrophota bacterium]